MKPQHTPGLWHVTQSVNIASDKGKIIAFTSDKIVNSKGGISAFNHDERKANAQLIARAPELLKENQELKESLNEKVKSGVEAIWERDFYKNQSIELLSALKDCEQVLWAYKDMIFRECAHNVNDQYNKAKAAISKAEAKNLVVS